MIMTNKLIKVLNFLKKYYYQNKLIDCIKNNNSKNLSSKEMMFLMKNADLNTPNKEKSIPLNYAIKNKNIFSKEEWKYLIENSNINYLDKDNLSILSSYFLYNKENNIDLDKEQIDYLIKNSNLNIIDIFKAPALLYYLLTDQGKILEKEQLDYLLINTDIYNLKIRLNTNKKDTPFLMVLFSLKEKLNLKITEDQWTYLIENSNLKLINSFNENSLMFAFYYNSENNLNLTEKQISYLIKNNDLKLINDQGWNSLFIYLNYNKKHNLNLTEEQVNYLIENSNINNEIEGINTLMSAFENNTFCNLNLKERHFDYLIKNSNLNFKEKNNKDALMYYFIYENSSKIRIDR